jgi:hypothetical protein
VPTSALSRASMAGATRGSGGSCNGCVVCGVVVEVGLAWDLHVADGKVTSRVSPSKEH